MKGMKRLDRKIKGMGWLTDINWQNAKLLWEALVKFGRYELSVSIAGKLRDALDCDEIRSHYSVIFVIYSVLSKLYSSS